MSETRSPDGDAMDELSTGRKLAFSAGTLLALVVVWFGGLELAVRLFDIGPEINPVWKGNYRLSADPQLRYELVPGSPDRGGVINRHGMRDRDYEKSKPDGVFRIAVVGDSITFGLSLPEKASFSAQLELLLEKYFREPGEPVVEVLNFGVTGYSFQQILHNVRTRVLDFEPDLIVYAYALNDPQEYSLEMDNLLAQLSEAEEDYLWVDESAGWLSRSRLVRLVRYLATRDDGAAKESPKWDEDDPQFIALRTGRFEEYFSEINTSDEYWSPIARGLDELARVTAERGVAFRTVAFPLLTDLERYGVPEVHAHLRREFDARGIPLLDLVDEYACFAKETDTRVATDALHPNAAGHVLAAVAILHDLVTNEVIPGIRPEAFSRLDSAARNTVTIAALVRQTQRMRDGEESVCAPTVRVVTR